MNTVNLVGRLTRDPELKQTTNGKSYTQFTVAVQRQFKNKTTGEYDADFISCKAWNSTAEFITKYFSKGKQIGIVGSIEAGKYDKDGQTIFTTDVNVNNVEFIGSKNDNQATTVNDVGLFNDNAESLPFEL